VRALACIPIAVSGAAPAATCSQLEARVIEKVQTHLDLQARGSPRASAPEQMLLQAT
jgi:hypothetical protein